MKLSYLLTLASTTVAIVLPDISNSTQAQLNSTNHLNNLSKKQYDCSTIDYAAQLLGLEKNGNTIVCKTTEQCVEADVFKQFCPSLTVSTAIPTTATPTQTNAPTTATSGMSITPAPTIISSDCANIDTAAKLLGLEKNGNTIVCKTKEQCEQADLYKTLCSQLTVSTAIPSATSSSAPNATGATSDASNNSKKIVLPALAAVAVAGLAALV
jgi:ribosomal protein L30/L7E